LEALRVRRCSDTILSVNAKSTSGYAHLNARIKPLARGERFEDPLSDALEQNPVAEVTGGGTMQAGDGEIEYCGIDLDLHDVARAVPFVCEQLTRLGAPRGSKLQYTAADGHDVEVPFGSHEGLAIYLNGTDLPAEVYEQSDFGAICEEIARLLGNRGEVFETWHGPTETAIYLYGPSVEEMRLRIADYLAVTPLCQRSRVVVIA
jgi:hypothetical protein